MGSWWMERVPLGGQDSEICCGASDDYDDDVYGLGVSVMIVCHRPLTRGVPPLQRGGRPYYHDTLSHERRIQNIYFYIL